MNHQAFLGLFILTAIFLPQVSGISGAFASEITDQVWILLIHMKILTFLVGDSAMSGRFHQVCHGENLFYPKLNYSDAIYSRVDWWKPLKRTIPFLHHPRFAVPKGILKGWWDNCCIAVKPSTFYEKVLAMLAAKAPNPSITQTMALASNSAVVENLPGFYFFLVILTCTGSLLKVRCMILSWNSWMCKMLAFDASFDAQGQLFFLLTDNAVPMKFLNRLSSHEPHPVTRISWWLLWPLDLMKSLLLQSFRKTFSCFSLEWMILTDLHLSCYTIYHEARLTCTLWLFADQDNSGW